ncbi:hypothetical protein GCM10022249_01360 [Enteractinococcus coprophilus]
MTGRARPRPAFSWFEYVIVCPKSARHHALLQEQPFILKDTDLPEKILLPDKFSVVIDMHIPKAANHTGSTLKAPTTYTAQPVKYFCHSVPTLGKYRRCRTWRLSGLSGLCT